MNKGHIAIQHRLVTWMHEHHLVEVPGFEGAGDPSQKIELRLDQLAALVGDLGSELVVAFVRHQRKAGLNTVHYSDSRVGSDGLSGVDYVLAELFDNGLLSQEACAKLANELPSRLIDVRPFAEQDAGLFDVLRQHKTVHDVFASLDSEPR